MKVLHGGGGGLSQGAVDEFKREVGRASVSAISRHVTSIVLAGIIPWVKSANFRFLEHWGQSVKLRVVLNTVGEKFELRVF